MSKGADTRRQVLHQALEISSEIGLEGLTFGVLAKRVGMSKSGLYAHFDSKEDLQARVLDTAAERFVDVVMSRVLKQPRGLPRVEALFHQWITWATEELSGGCPFIAAASEFDDRPGVVRDRVINHLRDVLGTISRAAEIAMEEGHFHPQLDVARFAFEFWSILLGHHLYARLRLYDDPGRMAEDAFTDLIRRARNNPKGQ